MLSARFDDDDDDDDDDDNDPFENWSCVIPASGSGVE